ncbi:MAG: zinc-binding alcohol dehydrogenase family protein [Planctomycetota bacterium]|jgi:L-gulonate 5-dehydrogenase
MIKAIKVNSPLNLEICEIPLPDELGEEELLVKVKAAGICGSDVHIYHGTLAVAKYPRIIGHEFVGEIVDVGSKVSGFHAGDHVAVDPVISCGKCYPCSIGRNNVCTSLKVRGVHVDGGFAEYVALAQKSTHKISKKLRWEEAVLIEPFSIAAQVVWRSQVTEKDDVLIMGAGPIGLAILQMAKKIGARCTVTDLFDCRLELAKKMSADRTINSSKEDVVKIILKETHGVGIPVVIEAVGLPKLTEDAVKIASPAGRIVILGFSVETSRICQFDITIKELDVIGSRLSANKFPEVIKLFNNNELNPELLVSHIFHFTKVRKALELIEKNPAKTCKIVLTFD